MTTIDIRVRRYVNANDQVRCEVRVRRRDHNEHRGFVQYLDTDSYLSWTEALDIAARVLNEVCEVPVGAKPQGDLSDLEMVVHAIRQTERYLLWRYFEHTRTDTVTLTLDDTLDRLRAACDE